MELTNILDNFPGLQNIPAARIQHPLDLRIRNVKGVPERADLPPILTGGFQRFFSVLQGKRLRVHSAVVDKPKGALPDVSLLKHQLFQGAFTAVNRRVQGDRRGNPGRSYRA